MEIIYRKLEELKKLENNPRTISDEQLDKLKESIRNNPDYFEARPIILSDRTGELIIIAGNQRYQLPAPFDRAGESAAYLFRRRTGSELLLELRVDIW